MTKMLSPLSTYYRRRVPGLKTARLEKRFSLGVLAFQMGVDIDTVREWEAGDVRVGKPERLKLCKLLGVLMTSLTSGKVVKRVYGGGVANHLWSRILVAAVQLRGMAMVTEHLGCLRGSVYQWITGAVRPSPKRLIAINAMKYSLKLELGAADFRAHTELVGHRPALADILARLEAADSSDVHFLESEAVRLTSFWSGPMASDAQLAFAKRRAELRLDGSATGPASQWVQEHRDSDMALNNPELIEQRRAAREQARLEAKARNEEQRARDWDAELSRRRAEWERSEQARNLREWVAAQERPTPSTGVSGRMNSIGVTDSRGTDYETPVDVQPQVALTDPPVDRTDVGWTDWPAPLTDDPDVTPLPSNDTPAWPPNLIRVDADFRPIVDP